MFLRIRDNTAQMINVEIVETDAFSNDNWATNTFIGPTTV